MKRETLLRSREYWILQIQNDLYRTIGEYMEKKNFNRVKLAEDLKVTKGYITQILNGEFDHKLSKLVDLSLACGKIPAFVLKDLEEYILEDKAKYNNKSQSDAKPIVDSVLGNVSNTNIVGIHKVKQKQSPSFRYQLNHSNNNPSIVQLSN